MESLQEKYSPNAVCFGCGPKNPRGLHLRSRVAGDSLVADWTPEPDHTSFAGFTSGGIICILLDCHGNMTAAYSLMNARGLGSPPGTVTSEFSVRFLRPTPLGSTLHLSANALRVDGDKVVIEGGVEVGAVRTVSMQGVYVAVKEGHPAFAKWS